MLYDYIPPKEIQENAVEIIQANDYSFFKACNLTNLLPKSISFQDYRNCAASLKEIFADGFQWHDIADIMHLGLKYFTNFFELTPQKKRDAILKAMDFLIDITDTPLLPDSIFDPIFKVAIGSLAYLLVPDDDTNITPKEKVLESPTEEIIQNTIREAVLEFQSGLDWSDIAKITKKALIFVNTYQNLSNIEKANIAQRIVNDIIDNIPTPLINNESSDEIFKDLAKGFIDNLTNTSKIFAT